MWGAEYYQTESVSYLLDLVRERYPEKLVDFVNEQDDHGSTALRVSFIDEDKGERLEILKLLCPFSDLTHCFDWEGEEYSYLEWAIYQRDVKALEFMLKFPFSNDLVVDALVYAVQNQKIPWTGPWDDPGYYNLLKKEADKRGLDLAPELLLS